MADNKLIAQTQRELDQTVQDQVNKLVGEENGLKLPTNYAVGNALKSAFFALKNDRQGDMIQMAANMPEMKTSIANALLDMVVQGLTPAKTQVYFIKYGKQIQMQRSYFGTQAALKRLSDVKDCWANVVKGNDKFSITAENDRMVVKEWEPDLDSLDADIKYAFAVIEMADGTKQYTIMTKKQIDNSWSQTKTAGAVQKKFGDEMAKRTVLNRAAKNILNTSDDSDLVVGSINSTTSNEYDNDNDNDRKDVTEEPVKIQDIINAKPAKTETSEETPKEPEETEATAAPEATEPEQDDEPEIIEAEMTEHEEPETPQEPEPVDDKGDADDAIEIEEQEKLFGNIDDLKRK